MFEYQKVKLIAVTKPVPGALLSGSEPDGEMIQSFEPAAEDLIAYCARVSNPSNQSNFDTAPKLLQYCIKKQHWSIFEMASVTIEIQTTRDIGRQILRHRSFSFQEFSQRYADPTKELGFAKREARLQDTKNRQNSIDIYDNQIQLAWEEAQNSVLKAAIEAYALAIASGIAKEQARAILPEGLTMSKMYMTGNLRSWIHYCLLRREEGTQKEHRDIAEKCWQILCSEFTFLNSLTNNQ